MSRFYYAYHNFTDSNWNNLSLWMQTKNYPELFWQVSWPWGAMIYESFIPEEKYKDWNRLWYLEVSDELLTSTWYTNDFINWVLTRMGSIFNLYMIWTVDELKIWIQNYTTISSVWNNYEFIWEL